MMSKCRASRFDIVQKGELDMQKRIGLAMILSMLLVGAVVIAGCGGGDNTEALNASGTWTISMPGYVVEMLATLTHTDTTIIGTITDDINNARTISGFTLAPKGSIDTRDITLIIEFGDQLVKATLTGTMHDNNNKMSGTFADANNVTGNWVAVRTTPE
jgi:hypothetical protein